MGKIKIGLKTMIILIIAVMIFDGMPSVSYAENVYTSGYYTFTIVNVGYSNYIATITKFSADTNIEYVSVPSSFRVGAFDAVVKSIPTNMMANYSKVKKVTLPDTITSIGDSAFKNCKSLISINLDNINYIGNNAFEGCERLSSVDIGGTIESINESTFKGCESLVNVTIPSTVTSIGTSAFEGCADLKRVHFKGNAPTSIGESVFSNCSDGLEILYDKNATGWDGEAFSAIDKKVWGQYLDCVDVALSRNYYDITEEITAPSVIVRNYMGEKLTKDINYTVEYEEDLKSEGTHTVKINGISPYSFSKELQYTVFTHKDSGSCGDNVYWHRGGEDDDTLYIFGTGNMKDVNDSDYSHPGYVYLANGTEPYLKNVKTVIIDEGVTSVGVKAFASYYDLSDTDFFPSLKTVYLPSSLIWVKSDAITRQTEDVYFANNDTIFANNYVINANKIYAPENSTAYDYADIRSDVEYVEKCNLHILLHHSSVAATVSSNGKKEFWECATCGKCYSNANGEGEISENSLKIFNIDETSIKLSQSEYRCDGTAKEPTVEVKNTNGDILSANSDYTLSYSNNVNAGEASVKIIFTGNYSGTVVKKFKMIKTYSIAGFIKGLSSTREAAVTIKDKNGVMHQVDVNNNSYELKYIDDGEYTVTINGGGNYIPRDYVVTVNDDFVQDLEIHELGDADCNGIKSAADLTRIARYVARLDEKPDDYTLKLYDTDKDNSVSASDATRLARYLARIIPEL